MLGPGDSHEYQSFCVLRSPVGYMEGYYTFVRPNGDKFRVEVPRFELNGPFVLSSPLIELEQGEEQEPGLMN